jgi:hypothetical protein
MCTPFGLFKIQACFTAVLVALTAAVTLPSRAQEPPRKALVIGNDSYKNLKPLRNAVNDAGLLAQSLRKLNFDVRTVFNADSETLLLQVTAFGSELANSDAVGLVYYAGHGVQIEGVNYLLPVDTGFKRDELLVQGLNLDDLLVSMASGRSADRLNIAVIDACRENLLGSTGLSDVKHRLPKGLQIFLAYSTSPGELSLDGKGSVGPYASALAQSIKTPFRDIDRVFNRTNEIVVDKTNGQQSPWYTRGFTGRFYFNSGGEDEFWRVTSGSKLSESYRDFLDKFPDGKYARTACVREAELTAAETNPEAPFDPTTRLAHCPPGIGGAVTGIRFAKMLTSPLRERALAAMPCEDLWTARNALLLQNGYCFHDARELSYFGNSGCTAASEDVLLSGASHELAFKNYHLLNAALARNLCQTRN